MASPEDTPANPHVLSFSNDTLGIHAEVTINHPEMERLSPEDRALLEKLLRAEVYTFALMLHTREDGVRIPEWRNQGVKLLDDIHETIFNLEGDLPRDFMRRMLGLDIEVPPYEDELAQRRATS